MENLPASGYGSFCLLDCGGSGSSRLGWGFGLLGDFRHYKSEKVSRVIENGEKKAEKSKQNNTFCHTRKREESHGGLFIKYVTSGEKDSCVLECFL